MNRWITRRERPDRVRGEPVRPQARANYVRAWLNETNPILDGMREVEGLIAIPHWRWASLSYTLNLTFKPLFCLLHSLENWLQFLWERAPPLVFGLLASGPCLSGLYLTAGHIPKEKFVWALLGELVSWGVRAGYLDTHATPHWGNIQATAAKINLTMT